MSDNFTRAWPSKSDRLRQQNAVAERIGDVLELLKHEPVAPQADVEAIRASLREFDFDHPIGTVLAAER